MGNYLNRKIFFFAPPIKFYRATLRFYFRFPTRPSNSPRTKGTTLVADFINNVLLFPLDYVQNGLFWIRFVINLYKSRPFWFFKTCWLVFTVSSACVNWLAQSSVFFLVYMFTLNSYVKCTICLLLSLKICNDLSKAYKTCGVQLHVEHEGQLHSCTCI